MAKHKSRRPRSSGKSNGIGKIIAGVLVLAVLIGAVCATGYASRNDDGKWFSESDFSAWHWKDKTPEEDKEQDSWGGAVDGEGNELGEEAVHDMPVSMAFFATAPAATAKNMTDPTVTVTCSHNFEYNNVHVDWSVEYPSGSSAEDVVTVTPTHDGSPIAKITCLRAFAEPLTLKVTERGNTENFATCKIDYIKRIESLKNCELEDNDFGKTFNRIIFTFNFSDGTISPFDNNIDYILNSLKLNISNDFQTSIRKYLKFDITFKAHAIQVNYLNSGSDGSRGEYFFQDLTNLVHSMFIENFDTFDDAHKNAIYYAWYNAYANDFNKTTNISVDIDFSVRYKKNVVQTISQKITEIKNGYITGEKHGKNLTPDLSLVDIVV